MYVKTNSEKLVVRVDRGVGSVVTVNGISSSPRVEDRNDIYTRISFFFFFSLSVSLCNFQAEKTSSQNSGWITQPKPTKFGTCRASWSIILANCRNCVVNCKEAHVTAY